MFAATLVALVGCACTPGEEPAEDGSIITLNEESASWPDALIKGRLSEREGCLLIGSSVAVFPFGTTWRSSDVVFPGGTTARVGAEVTMGGGTFDAADVTQEDLPIVPVAKVKECARRTGVTTFVWAQP